MNRNPEDLERTLEEFRDPRLGKKILSAVREKADRLGRRVRLMEVCGTHTVAFSESGLRDLLSAEVDLRSGPGCPVCVTGAGDIDAMVALARDDEVIVCTYGDMMRVPGSESSLQREKSRGADVRVVYSAADALEVAGKNPDRPVVFLAVGFETTVPGMSLALKRCLREDLDNFYIYSVQKLIPPALRALLADDELGLDGLVLPGHVSAVIGRQSLDFVGSDCGVPAVVAGFEPVDLLYALDELIQLIIRDQPLVKNAYPRAVREEGNPRARRSMEEFFVPADSDWRGLGRIPGSGLKLKEEFYHLDAAPLVPAVSIKGEEPPGCRCGDVLKGKIAPPECPLFAGECTPRLPVGPCMVSVEGACAAYYRFHREDG